MTKLFGKTEFTEQIRQKMIKNHKGTSGYHHSEETKRKISKSRIGDKHWFRIKGLSKEHRKHISDGVKKHRVSHPDFQKGKNHPCYGIRRTHSEKTKQKIREARLRQILPTKNTKIEIDLQNALEKNGFIFTTHYPILGQPDIACIEKKLAIFCDGCYWHSCPTCFPNGGKKGALEKDKKNTKVLQELGWNVLRFWEHDILNNLSDCINEIKRVYFY